MNPTVFRNIYVSIFCAVKSKSVPVPNWAPRRGGVKVWIHAFLASILDGGGWSVSRPGRFARGKENSTAI
jgi:hypothetical protein